MTNLDLLDGVSPRVRWQILMASVFEDAEACIFSALEAVTVAKELAPQASALELGRAMESARKLVVAAAAHWKQLPAVRAELERQLGQVGDLELVRVNALAAADSMLLAAVEARKLAGRAVHDMAVRAAAGLATVTR